MFYGAGTWIYRLRWWLIVFWLALLVGCLPFITHLMSPFKTIGFVDEHAKSTVAQQQLDEALGYRTNNQLIVLYRSSAHQSTNPKFHQAIKKSLAGLKQLPIKLDIFFPHSNPKQISKDKHTAYAVIIVHEKKPITEQQLNDIKKAIKTPKNMRVIIGGEPVFIENVNHQTQTDLFHADVVAAPVALITLILAFGSIVSAFLPIILGGGGAVLILTTLYFIGHITDLSIFTINIALLLGLCLCLDYCLFIVNRFRDELQTQPSVLEAISQTQATAGKAVFFSGLAVIASLSALFLFSINILFSIALGGIIAVIFAVLSAIVFLPAILCALKDKVNYLPVRIFKKRADDKAPFWNWLAKSIVRRPLVFFFPIMLFLLMLGYPFLSVKFGLADSRIFPPQSEKRLFFNTFSEAFNQDDLTPIQVTLQTSKGKILDKKNLYQLYDFTKKLEKMTNVLQVNSIVTTAPKLSKQQYYYLYHSKQRMSPDAKKLLQVTTRDRITLIRVISKYPINTSETKELVDKLSSLDPGSGMSIKISGKPASNKDVMTHISSQLPYAITWIIITSYIILLILLRSIFLPLKAIIMNLLSLCACYGALVLIFQDGYFHQLLNFEPQGMLDISMLVIIFCALFGFSMDYEVFLLTRIKEFYEKSGNNDESIIFGIEKSSRIITCAAWIVIVICGAFLVADVIMVKAFGLGIAVAIFVDAFFVRTLLTPSVMALMEDKNWYLPNWLNKILPS